MTQKHMGLACALAAAAALSACGPALEDSGAAAADPLRCDDPDAARSPCLSPMHSGDYYADWSDAYFDTMDYTVELDGPMPYSELVARWEWPPWLLLTAFSRENIESTDTLLLLYPSVVEDRDCRAFDEQPFGRCRVTFYYDDHGGRPCPIYEEFTFNDDGEITFIEAWSDLDGYLPMDDGADPWAEGEDVSRLSTRVPGLGNPEGRIDLDGPAMTDAAATDADVADFVYRANDWYDTWIDTYAASGDTLWSDGCGWDD